MPKSTEFWLEEIWKKFNWQGWGSGTTVVTVPAIYPTAATLHRTITGLWGKFPPLYTDAGWSGNPGQYTKARFYTDLAIRGMTALTDAPIITFRPYVRRGAYVGACQSISFTRPRLLDLATIKCQKTVNNGANYTDYSAAVVDNAVGTYADIDALDTLVQQDWLVVGGPVPFQGVAADMTANVNTNASTLTAEYWNGAWTALTNVTDGTVVVATKTFSGDGQITWSMPTDWIISTLGGIAAYWVRFTVSATLSATVEIAEIDLVMPMKCAIDVQADGDDVLLVLESQDATLIGTLAYEGSIYLSWR